MGLSLKLDNTLLFLVGPARTKALNAKTPWQKGSGNSLPRSVHWDNHCAAASVEREQRPQWDWSVLWIKRTVGDSHLTEMAKQAGNCRQFSFGGWKGKSFWKQKTIFPDSAIKSARHNNPLCGMNLWMRTAHRPEYFLVYELRIRCWLCKADKGLPQDPAEGSRKLLKAPWAPLQLANE